MEPQATQQPLTDHELNVIEAGIDNMDYSGSTVQRLIDEVRRQRAVLDQVDASTQRIEASLDRVELTLVEKFYQRVCARAELTIERTHRIEGAHYSAMQVELAEMRKQEALKEQWHERLPGDNHADRQD